MIRASFLSGFLLASLFCVSAHAQRMYVSDDLVITVRSGPSTRNAIVTNIRAGQAVEVLEENDDGDYYRIRVLDSGAEGWALSQYLVQQPVARDRLAAAQRELQQARDRVAELEQTVDDLRGRLAASETELGSVREASAATEAELENIRRASANVLELRDENEVLSRRAAELTRTVDNLTVERAALESRSRQNWFVVGAAVLLAGFVIGLIAPSMRKRRSSGW